MHKKRWKALGASFAVLMTSGVLWGEALPASYRHFSEMTEELVRPLVALVEEGRATLAIAGPPSDHGLMADELESIARPGLLLALWLQMKPATEHEGEREAVARWYREALVMGTDPSHPEYWGDLMNYHQHGVEMAIMTMSLTVARDWIWDPLSPSEREQVASWLGQIRGNARYWNNHLYFGILVLEFLRAEGHGQPGDGQAIQFMFELLEGMHMGNGWFKDGINETYDHYNAYAFHTYGMWWVSQYGRTDPDRARRWSNWARLFIQDYAHFYAASGEHIPYGRSITYRFNGLGVFGLAAALDLGALPLGEMRRLCRKNLEYFLAHPIGQDQGCLSIGWTDRFHGIAEPYSCAASPYWAAKGLMMLTLPPEHPFWTAEELPYPAERGDFVRVIPAPRFVLRGLDGEVELLNAGSQVSRGNARRYGPWKWSKLAYRTGHGFLVGDDLNAYPTDAVLTVRREATGQVFGRHPTIPLLAERDHLAYLYALGTRDDDFNLPVRTDVFWKGDWLLAIHQVESREPVTYQHGSFAIGLAAGEPGETEVRDGYALAGDGRLYSAVQSITGFPVSRIDRRAAGEPRRHLTHPYHATPVIASTEPQTGKSVLAVLLWSGETPGEGQPWTLREGQAGHWSLFHPVLGEWKLENPALPEL